jgi:hypothetical protein
LEEFEKQDSGRLTAYTDRTRSLGKAKTDIGAEWSSGDTVAVDAMKQDCQLASDDDDGPVSGLPASTRCQVQTPLS